VIVGGTDGLGKWSALNESLPGRIFISYRRRETDWPAGRLYDVLVGHFTAEQVFKDVDNIDPGDDFVERITGAVESCDVLLALIGPQWLTITNKKGQRRLDDPKDYVRIEIETALNRKIRVIPILVDEAKMPGADELPPTLASLARRNAVEINPHTFDTKRLIATVSRTLEQELARRQQAEEQARRQAEAEQQAQRAEEQARRQAEAEQRAQRAEEQARQQAEAEQQAQRAEEQARQQAEAEQQAQRAEEQARQQAEAEQQARRQAEAEQQARRQAEAEQQARRQAEAEQQAQRAEEQARARQHKEAEDRARRLRKDQRRRDTQQVLRNLRQRAAHPLPRRWMVVLAMSVGIGAAVLVLIYVLWTRTIMGQLPADLRASCLAKGTSATCRLPDGTVVSYRLFDTATEARADVVNGYELAPDGTPCPPFAAPGETPAVCSYEAGAETGVAASSQTVKPPLRFYEVRWNPDAHSRLRGAMVTDNTTAQGWASLRSNWTRLAEMD
jgi:TIR domain